MLGALAEAAAAFERDDWMEAARTNARFLLAELRDADGRLLRSWRAPYLAYAEDYAALLEALVTLAELDDAAWLADARSVAAELLRLFRDPEGGGFFTTGSDAEQLVVRLKDLFDDATPSANSLAANGLLRLATLTGDTALEAPAVEVMTMLAPSAAAHPNGFANLLGAIERFVTAPAEIAIVGDRRRPSNAGAAARGHRPADPGVGYAHRIGTGTESPLLAGREARAGAPTAYVCEHYACRQPVTEPEALRAQIDAVLDESADRSAGGEVGTGRELLGDGPAEGDHRLAPSRVERAHQRCDLRPTRGLHRARVEHGEARRLATLHRDPELPVVEVAVVAVALGQPPAPGPVLAVGRVPGAGNDVGVALQQHVTAGLRQPGGHEHVLVGEGDRGPAGQLTGHRLERRRRHLALPHDAHAPEDRRGSADALERSEHQPVDVPFFTREDREREGFHLAIELLVGDGETVGKEDLTDLIELGGLQRDGIAGLDIHRQYIVAEVTP